ncbi:MAG: hypothetical protein ACE5JN_03840 [Candidatus Methylomirabilia bacterium]
MKFRLLMLPTVGQPHELTQGMAGQRDDLFIWLNQGLSPHGRVLENLELFASKVIPRFK